MNKSRAAYRPYSYRKGKEVPTFSDDGPRTVMDAQCSLCARGASWIARHDRKGEFKIIPLQSALGQALMKHYGMAPDDPLSWLYLEDGRAYTSLDAVIRVGQRLGGAWSLLSLFKAMPTALQDRAYVTVAKNRYRLFGEGDLCALPDPAVQERLLS